LPPVEERLTLKDAAAYLGVHPQTLSRYAREAPWGVTLEPYRVGGRLFYTRELLDRWARAVADVRRKLHETLRAGAKGRRQERWAADKRVRKALDYLRAMGCKVGSQEGEDGRGQAQEG